MVKKSINGWKVWIAVGIAVITGAIAWGMTRQQVTENSKDIINIQKKKYAERVILFFGKLNLTNHKNFSNT